MQQEPHDFFLDVASLAFEKALDLLKIQNTNELVQVYYYESIQNPLSLATFIALRFAE